MRGDGAIWLVGMMGAGKSTVGPVLARALGRPFCDTDDAVCQRAGRSVREIFEQDGEPAFRSLERDVIETAGADGAVVALGGGALGQPGMAERLAERGTLVYLRARPDTLVERVGSPDARPLLAGLDREARRARLEALLVERESSYARAGLIVDVDERDERGVVQEIVDALAAGAGQGGSG